MDFLGCTRSVPVAEQLQESLKSNNTSTSSASNNNNMATSADLNRSITNGRFDVDDDSVDFLVAFSPLLAGNLVSWVPSDIILQSKGLRNVKVHPQWRERLDTYVADECIPALFPLTQDLFRIQPIVTKLPVWGVFVNTDEQVCLGSSVGGLEYCLRRLWKYKQSERGSLQYDEFRIHYNCDAIIFDERPQSRTNFDYAVLEKHPVVEGEEEEEEEDEDEEDSEEDED